MRVSSGVRMDLLLRHPEALEALARHHVRGQLKVAPEHVSDRVLRVMRKTGQEHFERFARRCGAGWVLVPEKNLARAAGLGLELPLLALRSRIEWDSGTDPLAWLRGRGIGI